MKAEPTNRETKNKVLKILRRLEKRPTLKRFLIDFRVSAEEAGLSLASSSSHLDTEVHGYKKVWEHAKIAERNAELGRDIFDYYLLSLYYRKEGAGRALGMGGFYVLPGLFLIAGFVGNTQTINIEKR